MAEAIISTKAKIKYNITIAQLIMHSNIIHNAIKLQTKQRCIQIAKIQIPFVSTAGSCVQVHKPSIFDSIMKTSNVAKA